MSLPVNSNLLNKKCGEVISSNCVAYAGPSIPGLCKGATMTEAIYQISENSSGCCEGNFPTGHQSCYTGNWVSFTIPASGTGGGYTWSTGSLGLPFGAGSAQNTPQYRWTKDGDLKIRGSFAITVSAPGSGFLPVIPLTTLPTTCFPTNGVLAQSAIIGTDALGSGNGATVISRTFLTIEPSTGILYLDMSQFALGAQTYTIGIYMGGTTFNLA